MSPVNALPADGAAPSLSSTGQIRRRVRYLRQLRELQLRDIGGFMVELHRFGRQRPGVVEQKVLAATQTDQELRTLERALGERRPASQLRQAGIGGACRQCGTVHGSTDRFCAWCGSRL